MRCVLILLSMSFASFVSADPPTVSRETTYYVEPLDAEGYVDYAAALDAAFGDADTAPQDNAFAGILQHLDTSDWNPEHLQLLYERLGIDAPQHGAARFVGLYEYAASQGLDAAAIDTLSDEVRYRAWTADEYPLVAQWLNDTAPARAAMVSAISRPNYFAPMIVLPSEPVLLAAMVPHLGANRALARSLGIQINLNLAAGDLDAAVSDVLSLERFSRLQSREPFLISSLVGISINALSRDAISALLNHEKLRLQHVLKLRDGLPQTPLYTSIERSAIEAERCMVLDLMQSTQRGRFNLSDAIEMLRSDELADVGDKNQEDAFGAVVRDARFDFDRALRRVNTFWDQFYQPVGDVAMVQSHAERLEEAVNQRRLDDAERNELMGLSTAGIPAEADAAAITDQVTDAILSLLALKFDHALITASQSDTIDQLENVGIALAIYHFDWDAYPKTLAELVPDYLDALPSDPFNPGQPFQYRLEAAGYLLYSINSDFEDDHGLDDISEGDLVLRVGNSNAD